VATISFNYGHDLENSALDRVRTYLSDIDPADWLLPDQIINYHIDNSGGEFSATSALARIIAGKFARDVNTTISAAGIAESNSDRFKHYMALADEYALMAIRAGEGVSGSGGSSASVTGGVPYVGGVDLDEMDAVDRDPDRPLPAFSSTDRRVRLSDWGWP
jgi:hypothetical protein